MIQTLPRPMMPTREEALKMYDSLGSDKWKEIIDGVFQYLGRYVFDLGSHSKLSRDKEPGYYDGLQRAFQVIRDCLGTLTASPELYKKVHLAACYYFNSLEKNQEAGKFRGKDHKIFAKMNWDDHKIPNFIQEEFVKGGCGTITNDIQMNYKPLSEEEIEQKMALICSNYNTELSEAKSRREALRAIARFMRCCEWLHPVPDGCGRTDLLLLNKHLVENGFTPVILDRPYDCNLVSLEDFINILERGMIDWQAIMTATIEHRPFAAQFIPNKDIRENASMLQDILRSHGLHLLQHQNLTFTIPDSNHKLSQALVVSIVNQGEYTTMKPTIEQYSEGWRIKFIINLSYYAQATLKQISEAT